MATDRARRHLVAGALALLPASYAALRWSSPAVTPAPALIGCCVRDDASYGAAIVGADFSLLRLVALPERGHGVAVTRRGDRAVVFGRRPSRRATVIDLQGQRPIAIFETPPQRHLFGHGFFSVDGSTLYATENDFENARSVLGVYDARADFRRLGEVPTGGTGAHETLLLRDGDTIAVANGGIETHPDYPRRKLNLADMAPSLSYLRASDGALVEQVTLEPQWHQVSLRHLAEATDGSVWIGGQFEGVGHAPLVFRHQRGAPSIEQIGASAHELAGYVGSIAAHPQDPVALVTSPRAGRFQRYDTEEHRWVSSHVMVDVCGAAATGDALIVSTGEGELSRAHGRRGRSRVKGLRWDNHLSAISPA